MTCYTYRIRILIAMLPPLSLIIHGGMFLCYYNLYYCYCEASTVTATPRPHCWEFNRWLRSITPTSTAKMNNKCKDDLDDEVTEDQIGLAGYKSDYALPAQQKQIKKGSGQCFSFQRFQSPAAILSAFNSVRSSSSSFKWFERKDRKGYFSSTKLGGDWVLAESKQVSFKFIYGIF